MYNAKIFDISAMPRTLVAPKKFDMNKVISLIFQDVYKYTHHLSDKISMYPDYMDSQCSYIMARGGKWSHTIVMGLQAFYQTYMQNVPSVSEVKAISKLCKHAGVPFNYEGWLKIAKLGYFPLEIESMPEGTAVPTGVPLVQVHSTKEWAWLASFIETTLLRAIWYSSTVATHTAYIRKVLDNWAARCGVSSDIVDWMMHNFGSRGATCAEADLLSGMAHLTSFYGTDSMVGIYAVSEMYGADLEKYLIGASICATEHSTITAWGRDHEGDAYENLIRKYGFGNVPNIDTIACVSDSFNIWEALKKWKELEPLIIESGLRLVIRPDSGCPVRTPVNVVKMCLEEFGYTENEMGYKVLPNHIRVIQGDGVDDKEINEVCAFLISDMISIENLAFGQGGALVQKLNRDTAKFAMKLNEITILTNPEIDERGEVSIKTVEVYKDPIGTNSPDEPAPEGKSFKASLAGRQVVYFDGSDYATAKYTDIRAADIVNELVLTYSHGEMFLSDFETVRQRVKEQRDKINLN